MLTDREAPRADRRSRPGRAPARRARGPARLLARVLGSAAEPRSRLVGILDERHHDARQQADGIAVEVTADETDGECAMLLSDYEGCGAGLRDAVERRRRPRRRTRCCVRDNVRGQECSTRSEMRRGRWASPRRLPQAWSSVICSPRPSTAQGAAAVVGHGSCGGDGQLQPARTRRRRRRRGRGRGRRKPRGVAPLLEEP